MFRNRRSVVGLDIGSSSIKVVELCTTGSAYHVVAFGIEPMQPDSIVDGAIIDAPGVADAIRRLFDSRSIRTREVAASLSGNAVIVKKISVPLMNETDLAESIHWEAEQYIPFALQDVALDYQVVDSGADSSMRGGMDMLVVAAKKEQIADYTGVIAQAGRIPVVIDVDAFALQNAYEVNYGIEPETVIALLNVGASAINVNILSGDRSLFTRNIPIGGRAYTEALQKELTLPFESAERLKKGEAVNEASFEDALPVISAVNDNVILEIQKTFDFFKATTTGERIDRIVLSGGCAQAEGFVDLLGERFDVSIVRFDPFRALEFDFGRFGVDRISEVAALSAVAVGLALRRADDR